MSWISKIFRDKAKRTEPSSGVRPRLEDETPAASSADHAQILANLKRNLVATTANSRRSLDPASLQDDIDLYEAGYVDSITASEFLILGEKEYGVPLPDWLIGGQANTLDSLARYIENQMISNPK